MHIGITHNVPQGGAKRAIHEFGKELTRRGHTLLEIVPSTADRDWCPLVDRAAQKVYPLRWPRWNKRVPLLTPYLQATCSLLGALQYHRMSKAMAAWIDSSGCDLLFANDCSIMLVPPVVGYLKTPSLLYVHHGSHLSCEATDARPKAMSSLNRIKGAYYGPASLLWTKIRYGSERWAAVRAGNIACNSRLAQRTIWEAYGAKADVIHYGVDTLLFNSDSALSKGDFVLSAGSLTEHKSFDFVIEGLRTIPTSMRPMLVIASMGGEPGVRARLEKLAHEGQVVLKIVAPRSDLELVELYNRAKVFVFAARYEAFGLVALEAMACGTPVVGVEDGGYADCIVHGVTGYLTKRSPEDFGRVLAQLLGNAKLGETLGYNARTRILDYWTWTRAADELETCFAQLLKGQLPGRDEAKTG